MLPGRGKPGAGLEEWLKKDRLTGVWILHLPPHRVHFLWPPPPLKGCRKSAENHQKQVRESELLKMTKARVYRTAQTQWEFLFLMGNNSPFSGWTSGRLKSQG